MVILLKMKKQDNQYSIRLPRYIVEKVEKDAAKYEMKRAGMMAKIIVEFYEKR